MNLYQCENKAKDIGFDKAKFVMACTDGIFECQWLDAYFGLFKIKGLDGFVTTKQIDEMYPDAVCSDPYVDDSSDDEE